MAERDADGQLIVVARSTSLWDSDMPIPASLPDRLAAVGGRDDLLQRRSGPTMSEPLRVAASQKQLPGRS